MTRFLQFLTLALLLAGTAFLAGCSESKSHDRPAAEKTLYTCGMHPQVIQDHPGDCPICGMKLVPIRKQAPAGSPEGTNTGATVIAVDPVTQQTMGIRTGLVESGPVRRLIRTVATIDFDETSLTDVTVKFKGWIEKLDADTTGSLVMRGDPLFEIYSPDLYSAEAEYLLALEQTNQAAGGGDSFAASALTKLKFYDISDAQIADLEKTRVAKKTLRINAPRDGIIVEKDAVQGQMVDAGMKLYRLADLSLVWALAQIYEQDLPFVKLGQEAVVKLSYFPDREFRGRVTYIYPTVDEKTRTAHVRMEFHNPGYFLKPGMYASAELRAELAPGGTLVPDSAVLRSGEKNTVFVALADGKFEPRAITLGPRAEGDFYQVYSGLKQGERVVTSGQFMLDSESQLREAIQKMREPGMAPAETGTHEATATSTTEGEATAYICPMPEHIAIKYNHPGTCPICGMTLVPVSEAALARLQPGGKLLYYTCPMPEHSDVHLAQPGKCPKCGMTLIPVMEAPAVAVPVAAP